MGIELVGICALYGKLWNCCAFFCWMIGTFERTVFSIIAQLSCFLQIIFILRGTYELIYEKAFSRRRFSFILLVSFIVAFLSDYSI